jgi:DNA replication protein DnaC
MDAKEYQRVRQAGIPQGLYDNLRFDNFERKTEVQQRAYQAAQDFCWYPKTDDEMDIPHDYSWSILLHGSCGTGKTHLAVAIARVWIHDLESFEVVFYKLPELMQQLRQGYDNGTYYDLIDRVKQAQYLILDDWGSQKATDWVAEQLDSIIDYRYSHYQDTYSSTVVTTNQQFKDLQPRVRSRLGEGVTVNMTGDDYRLIKGLSRISKGANNG